jgi:hypothetical protein
VEECKIRSRREKEERGCSCLKTTSAPFQYNHFY